MDEFITKAMSALSEKFSLIDETAVCNQKKVLDAFVKNRIALRHFSPTTGYGYDDIGRDSLNKLYADVFKTQDAIVSPLIASGTHAITIALFGLLRPGDTLLCLTGNPYDTLHDVVFGNGIGSLRDFGINCEVIQLKDGCPDMQGIISAVKTKKPCAVLIQRSKGYEWRKALSVSEIDDICQAVRRYVKYIAVDNCYGEFVETIEPTAHADVVIGSLIKNPGGGIAPTGGYICGTKEAISLIEGRLTAPSIGREVGSYAADYRLFYQGLFLAPHVCAQSIKTALLFSKVLTELGYITMPSPEEPFNDIICSIKFNDRQKLIDFCKNIQSVSPVDSFAAPEPWAMPGYSDPVIMAAGAFVQGASIELSCDAPVKPPYIAYLQGGLTFEHGIIAIEKCIQSLVKRDS